MNNEKEKDEEISIDFSKIAGFFKKKKKKEEVKKPKEKVEEEKKEQEPSREKEEIKEIKEEIKKPEEQKETEELEEKSEKKEEPEEIKEKAEKSAEIEEEKEEEIAIDLSKIKNLFKIKEKPKKEISEEVKATEEEPKETKEEAEEEISLDLGKFGSFLSKYKFLFLLLIPIFLSIFFRAYPFYLPVTDDWARSSVHTSIKLEIERQINEQYPFLSDANKQAMVKDQFEIVLKQQSAQIEQQVKQTSNYFKSKMKDENGQTYLLAIDPYLWYGEARNYLKNGHFGDKIINNTSFYMLRNGRIGRKIPSIKLNPYLEVQLYKFLHFFNRNISLVTVAFLLPLIIVTLSVIPAFFIAKKIGGNLAGLFAAIIVAISPILLSRTPAGFADTDPYQVFFPLVAFWLFLEAFEAKNKIRLLVFASLSGLSVGIYSTAWLGWWYIFGFILAVLVLYFIYLLIVNIKEIKKGFLKYITHPAIKNTSIIAGTFFLSSAIFVSLFQNFNTFILAFEGPLRVIMLKAVAVTTLWPNVLTTVAEFNVVSLPSVISQIGGKFLFSIALLGIILTMIKKDKYGKVEVKYAIFLIIWFIATIYGSTKGMRFILLLVPAFAIAIGSFAGITYQKISGWLAKEFQINKIIVCLLIIFLLFFFIFLFPNNLIKSAHRIAETETPGMNDAWYETLTEIKNNSTDAIITSWWDFGHWFVTIAERRVTFDGADQGRRIHWVGRSLLTSNEEEAIGILRMLNCGQEEAFNFLDSYINDTVKSINILYEIILQDKKEAKKTLLNNNLSNKEADSILRLTHCDDLIDQYYITSEDMIQKAGVWAHFGSWDFERAAMFNAVKGKPEEIGIKILEERFNLSTNDAFLTYHDIQKSEADRWISEWPGYASGVSSCSKTNDSIRCGNGLLINLTSNEAFFQTQQGLARPKSFVFADEKGFSEIKYPGNTIPYSAALIREGDSFKSISMDPALASSMFTRLFFFNGYGLKHFKLFSYRKQFNGQAISVWKVDFES